VPSLRIGVRSGATDAPLTEPTEVAWMNGAVARIGAEVGVATPVNACLAALVEDVATDPKRRAWFGGHPERLLTELAGSTADGGAAGPTSGVAGTSDRGAAVA
jgi:hypothetical protein